MKIIKIIGIFLYQKVVEIGQILVWKEDWRTPGTVVIWIRTLVYIPAIVFGYYYFTHLTWYIIKSLEPKANPNSAEYWILPLIILFPLFLVVIISNVAYRLLIKDFLSDFGSWFSKNWREAKEKAENKK
jgi:hypothetical protein